MARSKFASPTLQLQITAAQHEDAVASNSGACLIADAIKEQYPQFSGVTVDMATIRVSDRKKGMRYTYLTPSAAQHLLLSFDQGWPQPLFDLTVRRAVKVTPIVTSPKKKAERQARLVELETKEAAGEKLTKQEKGAVKRLRQPSRPTAPGKTEVQVPSSRISPVIAGGANLPRGEAHPNLLRGRDRHFGAKLADPGLAFTEAVEAAVEQRLAEAQGEAAPATA